jgi:rRNA biogenesis protein RRP5
MPGNVVEAHITEIQDIGAVGKFMGHFDATIDYFHTSKGMITSKKEIEETFKVNDKVRARVLYIDLASQPTRIGLSNAKHVMGLTQPNTTESELGSKVFPGKAIPIGRSFETVAVKRIDPRHGLLCTIDGVDIPAYVHISRVSDEHLANISATGKFRVDSTHRGVVLGYDPVDGLFQMSLQESMVDQPFLRIEDIAVGSIVKGTVAKVSDKGVIVSLAKNIKGFVPLLHCVDSAITNSTKKHVDEKFKEGKAIKCRVLSADAAEGRVILTCKDSLISSKHPIFTSLDDITPGTFSDGVIVKVNPHGCIVSFYNNVKAFAHISELQETHVNNLGIFQPGQVKTCRVLEVNAAEQNMKVSFKKSSEIDLGSVQVGSVHKGKIVSIKKDLIHLTLKPSETKAVIHATHLSDHLGEQAERIFSSLKEGMIISDLVVLSKDETRGSVMVTKKPILVLAAKEKKLITERAGLKEGHIYPAFVRQVAKFGVFVEFANGIEALAFRHSLSDASDAVFVKNQSVLAKVLRVDPTDGKTEVSLKPSDVSSFESVMFQGEFLAAFFKQLERLAKKADSTVSVGACTLADVKTVGKDEWTISYGAKKTASIAANQVKEVKIKPGAKCAAKVLDVDFEQDSVDFTLKDTLISAEEAKEAMASKFSTANISKSLTSLAALQKAQGTVEAVVELVKDDYLVLSIPEVNNMIAFAATRSLNNRKDRFIGYKTGEKVKAIVAYVPKSQVKGQAAERVILSVEQASVSPRNGATKEAKKGTSSIAEFDDVKEGSIISARVANIQHTGMDVHLGGKVFGRIHLTNLADTYAPSETLLKNFKKGQLLKCFVLHVDTSNKKIDLSLRPSRLAPENHSIVHDPEVKGFSDLAAGGILQGYVSNVADKGLFVALNHKLSGRVKIAELSDDYLKDWKSHFTVGQVVKAKIVSASESHHQIELTLKASQIDPSIKAIQTLADFTKGEKVKGTIKAVKDIGVFIKIDNSTVSGLCHISEISENHVPDVSKLYAVGDPVKAKILDIDMEKKRISFGLKSSYFEEGDAEVDEDEEDEDVESAAGSDEEMEDASDDDVDMGEDDSDAEDEEESDGEVENIFAGHDDSDSEEFEEDEAEEESKIADDDSDVEMTDAAPLAVASGFNWDGKDDAEEDTKSGDSDSEDDSDDERSIKKKKAKKQATVVQDDTADLESQAPQVASDYERLLLGSPNSSYLWINYMAFQLQLSEISKAREIGQRALKSISFREEQEKMNVWVALMNLENTFGSADTLEEVFKNAVQTCEPKKIYLQLVKIYERSNKIEVSHICLFCWHELISRQSPRVCN